MSEEHFTAREIIKHARIGAKILFTDGVKGTIKRAGKREKYSTNGKKIILTHFHNGHEWGETCKGYLDYECWLIKRE